MNGKQLHHRPEAFMKHIHILKDNKNKNAMYFSQLIIIAFIYFIIFLNMQWRPLPADGAHSDYLCALCKSQL